VFVGMKPSVFRAHFNKCARDVISTTETSDMPDVSD
jgi:hypothetical protein